MSNRLADSTSPYLLQHADNPVHWQEWGPDAFAEAVRRDVPILLSVGYAACHWCHVMAHESFEDAATAEVMNAGFVCVKVDREERPDVDAVYMEATQAMTGSGGWPMTCFLTPTGDPFYCGTYFPPTDRHGMPSFTRLLQSVVEAWRDRRDDVVASGADIVRRLSERSAPAGAQAAPLTAGLLDTAATTLAASLDTAPSAFGGAARGGFGGAPKFPPSMALEFLLRTHARTGSATGARGGARRPASRWPAAACTTSSRAGSPGTASTPTGSSRTSRRCSTTTPCWPGCTCTGGGRPARRSAAGSRRRPATGCCATCAPRRAGWPRPWTPTPTGWRG